MTRDEFRNAVFERDGHKCVVCGSVAKDAHHIIERRLFPDGGYYIENGASVCEKHHLEAESTTLSCDELREKCDIRTVILPPHFYPDERYDKWGNQILPNGTRLRGELFHDESVQKVIKPAIHLFTNRVKYPRTHHLPWSPGVTNSDRILTNLSGLEGQEVVVTVKMDGENTTLYHDWIHSRSIEYDPHPSRSQMKAYHASIAHDIPEGWRVCGENLWATHSITYTDLPHFFMMFSIWNDRNLCMSWDETKDWAALLGFAMVPELYRGIWDEEKVKSLYTPTFQGNVCEGYVVRVARAYSYAEFRRVVGKFVRKDHVQTHGHWMKQAIKKNGIK